MSEALTLDDYKRQAQSLQDYLRLVGVELKRTNALEAIARMHGYKDYQTLRGTLEKAPRSVSPYAEAWMWIETNPGTESATSLAKLLLSLWPRSTFSFSECIDHLDDERTDLALRVIIHFASFGLDRELTALEARLHKAYPQLSTNRAASGFRVQERSRTERANEHASDMHRNATPDEMAGMTWWNSLSVEARRQWLEIADTAVVAEAWAAYKAFGRPNAEATEAIHSAMTHTKKRSALRNDDELAAMPLPALLPDQRPAALDEQAASREVAHAVRQFAVHRRKDVARGAETPRLAAFIVQQYGAGAAETMRIIFDRARAADAIHAAVDDEASRLDPEWRKQREERWAARPADLSFP